jgi:hypothetical protein
MGRKNLPANAALKTAEIPGLGKLWPVWTVLVAYVWIAFSPVLSNGFVDWDDQKWILENQSFRGLGFVISQNAIACSTTGFAKRLCDDPCYTELACTMLSQSM